MLELVQSFGYTGLFVTIFGEIGLMLFPLPGDTLIFGSGILASEGIQNIYVVCFLVFVASVLGGEVGYWIGKKLGREFLLENKYYKVKPEHLHKTEKFFEKYGDFAILASRFVPVVRNFISQICGLVGYSRKKFIIYNILASLIWPAITVTLGFYFGKMFPNGIFYMEIFMAITIIIGFAPFVYDFAKKLIHKHKGKVEI